MNPTVSVIPKANQNVSVGGSSNIPTVSAPQGPTNYNPTPSVSVAQGVPQTQDTSTGQEPSWWEKLLPTAGGVLGGIAGTFVSPVLGSAAGAGIGGALGQQLENYLTGQKQSTLGAGVENAVGGLVGGGVAKAGEALLGRVLAPTAEKFASSLVAGQAPSGAVSRDLATYLTKDVGVTDLSKAGNIADVLTGGAQRAQGIDGQHEITKLVENTLQNNGPKTIDLSAFQPVNALPKNAAVAQSLRGKNNIVEQAINANNLSGTPSGNAIRTNVGGIVNSFGNPGSVNSLDALGAQRDISALAAKEYNTFTSTRDPVALDRFKALQSINNNLKSTLQLDQIKLNPDDLKAFGDNLQNYLTPIDKKAASNIANQIRNLKAEDGSAPSLADLRNVESNFVQVKGALQDAEQAANKNFGTSTANIARQTLPVAGAMIGGPKSALGTIGGLFTASSAADKLGAAGLSKFANAAQGKVAQKVLPLATRASAISAANLPNIATSGQPSTLNQALQGADMQGVQGAQGVAAPNALQQAYNQLLQQETAGAGLTSNSGALISAINSLAPQVNKQQLAGTAINQLLPSLQNAGGPQGLGSGLLAQLTGLVPGTAANIYGQQQNATAAALGQALGISPAQAAGLTPQLMANRQNAQPQITALQQLSSMFGAPTIGQ